MSDFPPDAGQKSVDRLFDYTKFHVGIYVSLGAALTTIGTAKVNERLLVTLDPLALSLGIICLFISGMSAGVILSAITKRTWHDSEEVLAETFGPTTWWQLEGARWAHTEHTAFWLAIVFGATSFLLGNQHLLTLPL